MPSHALQGNHGVSGFLCLLASSNRVLALQKGARKRNPVRLEIRPLISLSIFEEL